VSIAKADLSPDMRRPNRRLQLTAFGARDRRHFDSFCPRLGGS